MLSRANRLAKDKDFERVFKSGQASYSNLLGLKANPNQLKISRFGILVSSKISKKAVIRNKIRRQIRETIRSLSGQIKNGYDIVIISFPPVKEKKYQEIFEAIKKNLDKLKLIK